MIHVAPVEPVSRHLTLRGAQAAAQRYDRAQHPGAGRYMHRVVRVDRIYEVQRLWVPGA